MYPLVSREVAPAVLGRRELCRKAEVSLARLGQAVGGADLAPGGDGLGRMLEHAVALRGAVYVSLAFFGVRRASGAAGFRAAGATADEACSVVEINARSQKNDHFGVGQMDQVVALPSWGGACTVRLVSERLWFRAWLVRNRDHAGGMAASMEDSPLFVGLTRARFGPGLASSGVTSSWKKGLRQ